MSLLKKQIGRKKVSVTAVHYSPDQEVPGAVVVSFSDFPNAKKIELVGFSKAKILDIFFNGEEPRNEYLARAAEVLNVSLSYIAFRIGEDLAKKGAKVLNVFLEAEQRKFLEKAELLQEKNPSGYFVELNKNSVIFFPPSQIVSPEELKRRTVRISIIQRKKKEETG